MGFQIPETQETQRSGCLTRVGQDVRLRHRNVNDIDTNIVVILRGGLSVITPDSYDV